MAISVASTAIWRREVPGAVFGNCVESQASVARPDWRTGNPLSFSGVCTSAAQMSADAADDATAAVDVSDAAAAKGGEEGEGPTMRDGAVVAGKGETRHLASFSYCESAPSPLRANLYIISLLTPCARLVSGSLLAPLRVLRVYAVN